MITGAKDPNGNESTFAYDTTYGLFPVTFTDAAGHPTELERGELPFQVATVTDANDNETEFAYDPSGLPKYKAVKGKLVSSAWQGDPTTDPTEQYTYDFTTTPIQIVVKTRQVRLGATIRRHRATSTVSAAPSRSATPPSPIRPPPTTDRWRVTGWQIFNHKGLVVRAYQPTFATKRRLQRRQTRRPPWSRPPTTRSAAPCASTTPTARTKRRPTTPGSSSSPTATTTPAPSPPPTSATAPSSTASGPTSTHPPRTYLDAFGREIAVSEDNGTHVDVEQVFRVTTYAIGSGSFTGTTYDLALKQPLKSQLLRDDPGRASPPAPRAPATPSAASPPIRTAPAISPAPALTTCSSSPAATAPTATGRAPSWSGSASAPRAPTASPSSTSPR